MNGNRQIIPALLERIERYQLRLAATVEIEEYLQADVYHKKILKLQEQLEAIKSAPDAQLALPFDIENDEDDRKRKHKGARIIKRPRKR